MVLGPWAGSSFAFLPNRSRDGKAVQYFGREKKKRDYAFLPAGCVS